MNLLNLLPFWVKLAIVAAVVSAVAAFYAWRVHVERDIGRAEVQLAWDAAVSIQRAVDLQQAAINAKETVRRLAQQQENQRAQDKEIAAARRAAADNARVADSLRDQNATTAKQWRDALSNSPSSADLEAAAAAIRVSTELLGRATARAGLLAAYSDAARAAGLKCERDYDALTATKDQP